MGAMYEIHNYAQERQQDLLNDATEVRYAQRFRRLSRAARRADRAERRLTRSWQEAARRRAELTQLVADPWR